MQIKKKKTELAKIPFTNIIQNVNFIESANGRIFQSP